MMIPEDTITGVLANNGFQKKKLKEFRLPVVFKDYWPEIEFAPFCDKAQTKGVLLFDDGNQLRAVKYELGKIKPNRDGISASILCDFCFTLRARNQTALITFDLNREKTKSVAHYCCADLQCSLHVRALTDAALRSKTQIREDITPEGRIDRFVAKTAKIFDTNGSITISAE